MSYKLNCRIVEIESLDSNAFKIGEQFDSFEAITEKLNCYCKTAFVRYWTRDSRKINESNSKVRNVNNLRLKYYSLRYTCVLGGQEHRSRGSGKRYSLSIRATNCPAFISFRLTKDGQYLEVSAVDNGHNHEQSEESFRALPKERKLPDEIKADILDLIILQVDKERVKEYVRSVTQKVITSKDLANLINGGRLQSRPEITTARSKELLAKIYHHEVETSMLDAVENERIRREMETENETCTSLRIIAPKAKKRKPGHNLSIPEGLVVHDTKDCTSVYVCAVSEPVTEVFMGTSPSGNDQPYETLATITTIQPEDWLDSDFLTDVIEDSEQYCVSCGQCVPKNKFKPDWLQ